MNISLGKTIPKGLASVCIFLQKNINLPPNLQSFLKKLGITNFFRYNDTSGSPVGAQLSVIVFAVVVIDTDVDVDDAADSNAKPEVSVDADADARC